MGTATPAATAPPPSSPPPPELVTKRCGEREGVEDAVIEVVLDGVAVVDGEGVGVAVTSDGVGDREVEGDGDVVGLADQVGVAVGDSEDVGVAVGDGEDVAADCEGEAGAGEGVVVAMEDLEAVGEGSGRL